MSSGPGTGDVHIVGPVGIDVETTVGQPVLSQEPGSVDVHIVEAVGIQSETTVGQPPLAQVNVLDSTGIEAETTVGQPPLSQINVLSSTGIESETNVGQPGVGQVHVLAADGVESATTTGQPPLSQINVLSSTGIEAETTVGQPGTSQSHDFSAVGLESETNVGQPPLAQTNVLGSTGIESATNVGVASSGQSHDFSATGIKVATEVGSTALGGTHAIAASGIQAETTTATPGVAQVHAVSSVGLSVDATVGLPMVSTTGIDNLEPVGIASQPEVESPSSTQTHGLTATGLGSQPELSSPASGLPSGGAKHMKCCCNIPGGCDVAEDDFNRPDNADPGPLWTEVDTGDAEILSNRLRMNSGLVVTSARQIPPIAPGTNYAHSIVVTCSRALSHTVFEIVLNFSDDDNYSLVRMTYSGSNWEPEFINVSGGSDTVVADKTTHPQTGLFSSDANGNLRIQICYAEAEWTISDVNSQQAWTICGATPRTTLPTDTSHGLVGFRGTGLFDDWDYNVHWESRRECFPCSCFCRLTDTDFLCVPEELKLTWVPTSGAFCETNPMGGTDCCPTPFSTEMTLYQQLPTTPAPSLGPSFTAPTFGASRKTASKLVWRSGLLQFEAGNTNINGTPHWVMLVCDLNERNFYLLIDQYPWNDPFLVGTGAPGGLGYNGQKVGWASPDLGTSGSSGGARSAKYANKARSTCDPLTLTFEGLTYTRSSLGPLCEAYGSTYEAVVTEP